MGNNKFFCFILGMLLCCASTRGLAQYYTNVPIATNAIIDLRKQTFNDKLPLNGQWEFYWHQLLKPGEVAKGGELVNFPFKWNGYKWKGEELPAFGYASFKLTILMPPNCGPMRLAMPDVYCAYRLFVNDENVGENGQVSTTAEKFVPHWE